MSKIAELINHYFPFGGEYKKTRVNLLDVATYVRGVTYKKNQEVNVDGADGIRVLRANNITLQTRTINYTDVKLISPEVKISKQQWLREKDILMCSASGSKEHIGKVAYIFQDMDYTYGGFMGVLRVSEEIHSRFLYHIMSSDLFKKYLEESLNTSTINNINNHILRNFVFDLPPLEVQNEIVRILDNFTELEADLAAELEARTKQYEYYRNKLLDFSTGSVGVPRIDKMLAELCPNGVELRTIEDIGTYRRGSFPQPYGLAKWYDDENGMPFVQVVDVENDKFLLTPDTRRKISIEAQKMSVFAPIGTLIVTIQGTIGRVAITQYEAFIDRTLLVFKETDKNINKKFLAYVLKQKFALEEKTARGSTLKTITKEELKNFLIPIPPLEIQEEIVRILDTFSEYVTSISQGLPAEIAARRKQYEYYRNKLLTF